MSKSIAAVVVVLVAMAAAAPRAQESRSAEAAATLTRLMQQRGLDAVAARDPEQSDRYVAALLFPGSQLLVIGSVHPVPALVEERVKQQQYRDVYTDLHGAGVREGRVFVTDLQANGLQRTREPGEPFDIVYRNGVDQSSYDGDWKGQKLTASQYNQRFQKDDADYARMLTALIAALRAASSTP